MSRKSPHRAEAVGTAVAQGPHRPPDAMNCQREIAEQMIDQGADYLLAFKAIGDAAR